MAQVICLSDSEESNQSATVEEANNTISESDEKDSEFNFPAVEFHYEVEKPKEDEFKIHNPESEVDQPQVQKHSSVKRKQNVENVEAAGQTRKKQRNIKPGDWLKTTEVCLDDGLKNNGFSLHITDILESFDISWSKHKLPITNSIKWITTNEDDEKITQEHILIIWNWDEAVTRVKNTTFECHLKMLLNLMSNPKPMLVLCGMEEYFQAKKGGKQTTKRPKNIGSMSFHDAPKITRHELEICLTQIQQNLKCSCRIVDIPEDLGPLVYKFTKSVAQIPYKQQQKQKLEQNLDWYANGDNRDTVRVDNSGNGLSRLWQQQLCRFTMASLQTAEAISSIYPSPLQLMTAYKKCTKNEGEKLLKDIPVRRAAGPLSTVRKIGPELSKKIFIMFTSKDGKAMVGN